MTEILEADKRTNKEEEIAIFENCKRMKVQHGDYSPTDEIRLIILWFRVDIKISCVSSSHFEILKIIIINI